MGDAGHYCFSSFCMEELFGNLLFKSLEFGTSIPYVVSMEGMQCPNFEVVESPIDMLKTLLARTLFE